MYIYVQVVNPCTHFYKPPIIFIHYNRLLITINRHRGLHSCLPMDKVSLIKTGVLAAYQVAFNCKCTKFFSLPVKIIMK